MNTGVTYESSVLWMLTGSDFMEKGTIANPKLGPFPKIKLCPLAQHQITQPEIHGQDFVLLISMAFCLRWVAHENLYFVKVSDGLRFKLILQNLYLFQLNKDVTI